MTNTLTLPQLREEAVTLRRAGKSRREIQQILQIRRTAGQIASSSSTAIRG